MFSLVASVLAMQLMAYGLCYLLLWELTGPSQGFRPPKRLRTEKTPRCTWAEPQRAFPAVVRTLKLPEAPPAEPSGEQRVTLRRGGSPVAVLVSVAGAMPVPGWVLDRSRGGLGICLDRPVAENTMLRVRASHAAEEFPTIPLRVRHCRSQAGQWLLGCSFVDQLPWSILLLFG